MDDGSASMSGSPSEKYATVTDADLPEFMVWNEIGLNVQKEREREREREKEKDEKRLRGGGLMSRTVKKERAGWFGSTYVGVCVSLLCPMCEPLCMCAYVRMFVVCTNASESVSAVTSPHAWA